MKLDEKALKIAHKAFEDGCPGIFGHKECIDEAIEAYLAALPAEDAQCDSIIEKIEKKIISEWGEYSGFTPMIREIFEQFRPYLKSYIPADDAVELVATAMFKGENENEKWAEIPNILKNPYLICAKAAIAALRGEG